MTTANNSCNEPCALPAPEPRPGQPDDCLRDWHRASNVLIYNQEAVRISRFVMAYPNLETGGDLFGLWTNSGAPVVSYVIGPGKDSSHHYASFYQDEEWLRDTGTGLYDRHGLQHIGEWHSHHRLGLDQPSGGDIGTVVRSMAAKNWSKFVLMIATLDASEGSPVVQSYYLVNPYGDYKPVRPRALPGSSPFRTEPNDPREETYEGAAANLGSDVRTQEGEPSRDGGVVAGKRLSRAQCGLRRVAGRVGWRRSRSHHVKQDNANGAPQPCRPRE